MLYGACVEHTQEDRFDFLDLCSSVVNKWKGGGLNKLRVKFFYNVISGSVLINGEGGGKFTL